MLALAHRVITRVLFEIHWFVPELWCLRYGHAKGKHPYPDLCSRCGRN